MHFHTLEFTTEDAKSPLPTAFRCPFSLMHSEEAIDFGNEAHDNLLFLKGPLLCVRLATQLPECCYGYHHAVDGEDTTEYFWGVWSDQLSKSAPKEVAADGC